MADVIRRHICTLASVYTRQTCLQGILSPAFSVAQRSSAQERNILVRSVKKPDVSQERFYRGFVSNVLRYSKEIFKSSQVFGISPPKKCIVGFVWGRGKVNPMVGGCGSECVLFTGDIRKEKDLQNGIEIFQHSRRKRIMSQTSSHG